MKICEERNKVARDKIAVVVIHLLQGVRHSLMHCVRKQRVSNQTKNKKGGVLLQRHGHGPDMNLNFQDVLDRVMVFTRAEFK